MIGNMIVIIKNAVSFVCNIKEKFLSLMYGIDGNHSEILDEKALVLRRCQTII